jgi:hypothetical protein
MSFVSGAKAHALDVDPRAAGGDDEREEWDGQQPEMIAER